MASISAINQRLQKSFLGRRLRESMLESVGYDIDFAGKNRGFMGLKSNLSEVYKTQYKGFRSAGMSSAAAKQQMGSFGAKASRAARIGGRSLMSGMGLASTLYFVYSGYKEGGVFGAAKGAAESVLYGAAFRTAIMGLGNPLVVGATAIAAVGYGAYALGEAGQRYQRRLKDLEVGGDENMINAINSYGASTMRQRAAVALNNSHINRRLALGNEASLFHSSFRR